MSTRPRAFERWLLPLAIAGLWAASLVFPALTAGGRTFTGFELLVDGWQGVSRGVYAWFANPLFVAALACALLRRDRLAAALSAVAALLGATSIFIEPILRERMTSVPDIDMRGGFYAWMVALAALCLRSLTRMHASRRRAHDNSRPRHAADTGKSRD
jgi:hypothetical protein